MMNAQRRYPDTRHTGGVNVKTIGGRHDMASVRRTANLTKLKQELNLEDPQLALALEMEIPRVKALLEGQAPFSPELAQHIELMLELPAGWLDKQHSKFEIPEKTQAILRGEARSSMAEENHETEETTVALAEPQKLPSTKSTKTKASTAHEGKMKSSTKTNQQESPVIQTIALEHKESAMPSETDVQKTRAKNFSYLTAGKGAKAKLARMLGVSAGHITLLLSGERAFLDDMARNLETLTGLPTGWMDKAHKESDVPPAAAEAIEQEKPVGIPSAPESGKARRGRPISGKRPTEHVAAAAHKQATKPATAKPATTHAKPAAAQPQPVAAVETAEVAEAAPARTFMREATPAESQAQQPINSLTAVANLNLPPIVKALIETIADKASHGQLSEAKAYEMLGTIFK